MLYSSDTHRLETRLAPTYVGPTDEQLMVSIQQGDESALQMLMERHKPLMQTIVHRVINNETDADEVVSECLLEIWKHAGHYDASKGQALGWIVTLVRRRSIDRIRRKSAYWRAQDRLRLENEGQVEMQGGADEEAALGDRATAVAELIAKLPEAQQEVVRFTYFQGMSQRQIAQHTGIPLGTIKTRLELAMRKLKAAALAFGELHEATHATP